MKKQKAGFSMIEVAVALLIAGILLDTVIRTTAPLQDRIAVDTGRSALVALHSRARAHAVERGTRAHLYVDPATDIAWLEIDGDQIEVMDFRSTLGVDVKSDSAIDVCMGPSGFADTGCTSFNSAVTVEFSRGKASTDLQIRPLGQVMVR